MDAYDLEFWPGPINPEKLTADTENRLAAFNSYVGRELEGTRLFGAITLSLLMDRPEEVRIETDIASGKVGLEVAALTGELSARLSAANTPLTQTIFYPPVDLPDGSKAILKEFIDSGNETDDTSAPTRIPWLYILSAEALADYQNGDVDYLADVAAEAYTRTDLDETGRSNDEPSYASAQRVFFLNPRGPKARAALDKEKAELIRTQESYLQRLRAIANLVLTG